MCVSYSIQLVFPLNSSKKELSELIMSGFNEEAQ